MYVFHIKVSEWDSLWKESFPCNGCSQNTEMRPCDMDSSHVPGSHVLDIIVPPLATSLCRDDGTASEQCLSPRGFCDRSMSRACSEQDGWFE